MHFEDIIREAGREQRRVLIQVETTPGGSYYERELEPYSIENGRLIAFSYLRNEFRSLALAEIRSVEITPRSFKPRRKVEL